MNTRKRIALLAATAALGSGLAVAPAAEAATPAASSGVSAAVYGCNYTTREPTLHEWSKDHRAVKEAQCLLKHWHTYPGPVDGVFGPKTLKAVKAFQRMLHGAPCHLAVDGVVGKRTWHALKHALC